jgi:F0F1-type ATP synthase assembly protein I
MKPKEPVGPELGQAWRYESLGYTFAFSIVLFAGAGFLLDRWLGSTPLLTVLGTLVGAGLAIAWVFLRLREDEARHRAEHPPAGHGAPGPSDPGQGP